MTCPKCKAQIPQNSTSCPKCGVKFEKGIYCPHCRAVIAASSKVCPKCGKPVQQTGTYKPQNGAEKKKPSTLSTVIATVVVVFLVFGIIGSCFGGNDKKEDGKRKEQSSLATSNENSTPTPTLEPTPEPTFSPEELRENAKAFDAEVMTICGSAWDEYNNFMQMYSQEGISAVDLYRSAEGLKESLQQYNLQITLADVTNTEAAKEYHDYAKVYVYSMLDVAKKIIKYFDDPSTKRLAEVQEATEDVNNYVFFTATSRVSFLSDAGFTDDEVNQIVDSYVGDGNQ